MKANGTAAARCADGGSEHTVLGLEWLASLRENFPEHGREGEGFQTWQEEPAFGPRVCSDAWSLALLQQKGVGGKRQRFSKRCVFPKIVIAKINGSGRTVVM